MYAWIWRHLPFGPKGKSVVSLGMIAAVVALFWYVIFPVVEPKLPLNDGQIEQTDGNQFGPGPAGGSAGASRPAAGPAGAPGRSAGAPAGTVPPGSVAPTSKRPTPQSSR